MATNEEHIDRLVGRAIRTAREGLGLTQRELAERVSDATLFKLDGTALARIEAGSRSLRLSALARFANVLGVPIRELLPDEPEDMLRLRVLTRERNSHTQHLASAGSSLLFVEDSIRALGIEVIPGDRYDFQDWVSVLWALHQALLAHPAYDPTSDEQASVVERSGLFGLLRELGVGDTLDTYDSGIVWPGEDPPTGPFH